MPVRHRPPCPSLAADRCGWARRSLIGLRRAPSELTRLARDAGRAASHAEASRHPRSDSNAAAAWHQPPTRWSLQAMTVFHRTSSPARTNRGPRAACSRAPCRRSRAATDTASQPRTRSTKRRCPIPSRRARGRRFVKAPCRQGGRGAAAQALPCRSEGPAVHGPGLASPRVGQVISQVGQPAPGEVDHPALRVGSSPSPSRLRPLAEPPWTDLTAENRRWERRRWRAPPLTKGSQSEQRT